MSYTLWLGIASDRINRRLLVVLPLFTMLLKRSIFALLLITLLSVCESLKLKNIAKTGATTTVAYAVGGAIPAVANVVTSVTVAEVIPEPKQEVDQIETTEQATAYIAESLFMNLLYGAIAWMIITLIAVPFVKRWGYNQAKDKYKVNVRIPKDLKNRINNE